MVTLRQRAGHHSPQEWDDSHEQACGSLVQHALAGASDQHVLVVCRAVVLSVHCLDVHHEQRQMHISWGNGAHAISS